MAGETRSNVRKSHSLLPGGLFCTLMIVLASVVVQMRSSPPLNEYLSNTISSKKPYETFEQFYPHYLREHSQQTTRLWHYVGTSLFILYMLVNPALLFPILAGGLSAYSVMPFFRHLSNGLGEVGVFFIVYLIGGKLITRSYKKVFLPLLLGYSFAWIGHFFYEHNKPATFIYPTFSLMGDFRMVYDAIRKQTI
ncbi:unnamed protein product [Adineta ricciae]|uniref:Uncharacterized protein n=1 Tax=Adineta ricciae TaxID=249248 RepID=A0A813QM58_ADIRI|nr:unnamed protein product [Adineta ricciae]